MMLLNMSQCFGLGRCNQCQGTGGGLLWMRLWTFWFHKLRGISWLPCVPFSFPGRVVLHGVSECS